jgi:hypothetical protein
MHRVLPTVTAIPFFVAMLSLHNHGQVDAMHLRIPAGADFGLYGSLQAQARYDWSPWQPLSDGQSNGIDISYKQSGSRNTDGTALYYFRIRNRYRVPVDVAVAVYGVNSPYPARGGGKIQPGGVLTSAGQFLFTREISRMKVEELRAANGSSKPVPKSSMARATATQCRRALDYRDGRLAQAHRIALERYQVNRAAQADLQRFRQVMLYGNGKWWDAMPATGNWARLRDAGIWAINTAANHAKLAANFETMKGAGMYAVGRIAGEKVTPQDVIATLLDRDPEGTDKAVIEAAQRRAAGKLFPTFKSVSDAIAYAAEAATNVESLRNTDADRAELRRLVQTSLQGLDNAVARYAAAAESHRADLSVINDYQAALDEWIRTQCDPTRSASAAQPTRKKTPPSNTGKWITIP